MSLVYVVVFVLKRFASFRVFLHSLAVKLVFLMVKLLLCMYLFDFRIFCMIGGLSFGCQWLMFESSWSFVFVAQSRLCVTIVAKSW